MFLGIDASLNSTGWYFLDREGKAWKGTIQPPKGTTGPARLDFIDREFDELLAWFMSEGLHSVAIEGYAYASTNQLPALGEGQGIIRLALFRRNVSLWVVAPGTLKCFVGGQKGVKKDDMSMFTLKNFGLEIPQGDECDAHGLCMMATALGGNPHSSFLPLSAYRRKVLTVPENIIKRLPVTARTRTRN